MIVNLLLKEKNVSNKIMITLTYDRPHHPTKPEQYPPQT